MNKRVLQIVVLIFLLASSPFQTAQASLNNDGHTLLLLHFDNDLAGADGESPVQAAGVTFESGVLGSGVLVDSADVLDYSSATNFTPAAGTIEFWVKPRWSGADGNTWMFFGLGAQPYTMNDLIIQIRIINETRWAARPTWPREGGRSCLPA
jgi:hypothetical protein